jgi:hypothetical protein
MLVPLSPTVGLLPILRTVRAISVVQDSAPGCGLSDTGRYRKPNPRASVWLWRGFCGRASARAAVDYWLDPGGTPKIGPTKFSKTPRAQNIKFPKICIFRTDIPLLRTGRKHAYRSHLSRSRRLILRRVRLLRAWFRRRLTRRCWLLGPQSMLGYLESTRARKRSSCLIMLSTLAR